ncbi:MAG: MAPEG family protein [Planktomarina sp.]
MTPELTALTLAALLQIMQLILYALPANLELGTGKTLSPRDMDRLGTPLEQQVKTKTARLFRAYNNHFESLILFAIAICVITLADQSTVTTQRLAWIYLGARILYIPAYYFGLVPWRSLIWFAGMLATSGLLIAAVL